MPQVTRPMDKRLADPRDRVYLPELFETVNALLKTRKKVDKEQAIKFIQDFTKKDQASATLLKQYIECLYHPQVVLELPNEAPPYDKTQYDDYNFAPTTLNNALTKVKYFVKVHPSFAKDKIKREQIFIQILEGMYFKDAELFCSILQKRFPSELYPKINAQILVTALPQYFVGCPVEQIIEKEKAAGKPQKSTKNG